MAAPSHRIVFVVLALARGGDPGADDPYRLPALGETDDQHPIPVGVPDEDLPQFILGTLGMPRRYAAYPAEFQVLNVFSTAGATILGVGYLLPILYLTWSLKYGEIAGDNPWQATGLEWQIQSPPLTENFTEIPIVEHDAYDYEWLEKKEKEVTSVG